MTRGTKMDLGPITIGNNLIKNGIFYLIIYY